jgi:hypothetical protein
MDKKEFRVSIEDTPERGCYRRKHQKSQQNGRKVKLIEIAETLKTSKKRVGLIVHEYLDMRKLCAKWVPRVLTIDQKQQRYFDDLEQCFAIFKHNKDEFFMVCLFFTRLDCQSHAKPSEKDHDLPGIRTRDLWSSSQHIQPLHHLGRPNSPNRKKFSTKR